MYWGEWRLLPLFSVAACDFLLWLSSLSPFSLSRFLSCFFSLIQTLFHSFLSFSTLYVISLSVYFPLPIFAFFPLVSFHIDFSPLYIWLHQSVFLYLPIWVFSVCYCFFCTPISLFLFSFFSLSVLKHSPPPPSLTLLMSHSNLGYLDWTAGHLSMPKSDPLSPNNWVSVKAASMMLVRVSWSEDWTGGTI